jgi:hypothetical protein
VKEQDRLAMSTDLRLAIVPSTRAPVGDHAVPGRKNVVDLVANVMHAAVTVLVEEA